MTDIESNIGNVSTQLENGYINYIFDEKCSIQVGDRITAYVDGHEIGNVLITSVERGKKNNNGIYIGRIPIFQFPLQVKSIVAASDAVVQSVYIESADYLIDLIPWSGFGAQIESIHENNLSCETFVDSLPCYPRYFVLLINGEIIGRSRSVPSSNSDNSGSKLHQINFHFEYQIRESDEIAVIDESTRVEIINEKIDFNFYVQLLSRITEKSRKDVIFLKEQIENLNHDVVSIKKLCSESRDLERMDLYYHLLNSKIDRISIPQKCKSEERNLEELIVDKPSPEFPLNIHISEIEGIGIYELETRDGLEWRWLAPRATFALRDVPPHAQFIKLRFSILRPEANANGIVLDVNGRIMKTNANRRADGWELRVPLQQKARMPDGVFIIHIQFKDFFQPTGDLRLLSAILSHVYYEQ